MKQRKTRIGQGTIGRAVMRRDSSDFTVYRIVGVCVEKNGARLYALDDKLVRFHSYEPAQLVTISPRKLAKMPLNIRAEYVERLVNPPIVEKKSAWFPKSALRFVRGNYTAKI